MRQREWEAVSTDVERAWRVVNLHLQAIDVDCFVVSIGFRNAVLPVGVRNYLWRLLHGLGNLHSVFVGHVNSLANAMAVDLHHQAVGDWGKWCELVHDRVALLGVNQVLCTDKLYFLLVREFAIRGLNAFNRTLELTDFQLI